MDSKQTLLAREEYFLRISQATRLLQETLKQLCSWFEHISGGIHHILNSKSWSLGIRLVRQNPELKIRIEEVHKLVLHFQTWDGLKQRNSEVLDEINFKNIDFSSLSEKEIEKLLAFLELEISTLQLLKAKLNYNIEEISNWLLQIKSSYQFIVGSKTWRTGTRLINCSKNLLLKEKTSSGYWPTEISIYLEKFSAWHNAKERDGKSAFLNHEVEAKIFYKFKTEEPPLVSLILVNPKNASYLKRFFNSFLVHNSLADIEFLVLRNEQVEGSCLKELDGFSALLPIQTIALETSVPSNELKNYAAKISKARFIFFIEENLIFSDDLLHQLVAKASEEAELKFSQGSLLKEGNLESRELKQDFESRLFEAEEFVGHDFWNTPQPTVAFAVTESGAQATAGDYFTAFELANECRRLFGWRIKFLAERDKYRSWYDLSDVDLLISMVDEYDLRQIQNAKNSLITLAWLRNWFDRWTLQPWFKDYNICFCSSEKSAEFIRKNHDKAAIVFRIATNQKRFSEGESHINYLADCAFTGNHWKAKREIEDAFSPNADGPTFALYGCGWENHPNLAKYHRGFLPYYELPAVYRSTKIVLDDANHVTKSWGSVNSRVFDALASGCLVITNGDEGAREIFADLLPTYSSAEDLERKLTYYLSHEKKREELVEDLKKQVLEKHTYAHRALELKSHLLDFTNNKYRIAIKTPVPRIEEAESWGDYHFAVALKQEFEKLGHSVRIDILPNWNTAKQIADDVTIVLRGLSAYTRDPRQINLVWNISHPNTVSKSEYEKYEHVFVASSLYAKKLKKKLSVPVSTLFQCTNEKYFYPDSENSIPRHELLFVGNSRKKYRQIVKDAIRSALPISIYGTLWEGIVEQKYILGQNIPNKELRKYYSNAKIVLNDHWPAMSKQGFISNRIFDAAACGAFIISDQIQGAEELFSDALCTYSGAKDLKKKVSHFLNDEGARLLAAERLKSCIKEKHTFRNRVSEMLKVINELDRKRRLPNQAEKNLQESLKITKSHPNSSQKSVANL